MLIFSPQIDRFGSLLEKVADMWMWRRQLLFVMAAAAAVFGWTLVSGEELDDASKKGRSKFIDAIQ